MTAVEQAGMRALNEGQQIQFDLVAIAAAANLRPEIFSPPDI
jgi:cold shock CspA family protein